MPQVIESTYSIVDVSNKFQAKFPIKNGDQTSITFQLHQQFCTSSDFIRTNRQLPGVFDWCPCTLHREMKKWLRSGFDNFTKSVLILFVFPQFN